MTRGWLGLLLAVSLHALPCWGCSCFRFESDQRQSICNSYQRADDVYVATVLNGTCNCVPGGSNTSESVMTANLSCLTSALSDTNGYDTSVLVRTECNGTSNDYGISSCEYLTEVFQSGCPHEGQVLSECAPLCPLTCDNRQLSLPCARVCTRGCACPDGMVLDEARGSCVASSQCPSSGDCVSQSTSSTCDRNCFMLDGVSSCEQCNCGNGTVADLITGRCVTVDQCTACPIQGQQYTTCGSSCPLTCDNFNDSIICTTDCWVGCQCPSGTVIDLQTRECVVPSRCSNSSSNETRPPELMMRGNDSEGRCIPRLVCPHNTEGSMEHQDYSLCQYVVEVKEVFKGDMMIGDRVIEPGPDLQTSCGNPRAILRVGADYVVGIGGPCTFFNEWTSYRDYTATDREVLANLRDMGLCSSAIGNHSTNMLILITVLFLVIINQ